MALQPLKPNEKRMALALGAIGFLLVNVLLYMLWSDKMNGVTQREVRLTADITRLKGLQRIAPEIESKRLFIKNELKGYATVQDRDLYLNNKVEELAAEYGLTLRKNLPKAEVKREQYFHKTGYVAEVVGPWGDVLDFVLELQAPKEFRVVTEFDLKSQKDQRDDTRTEAICRFEIEKWWSPDSTESFEAGEDTAIGEAEGDGAEPAPARPADTAATPDEQPAPAEVTTPVPASTPNAPAGNS